MKTQFISTILFALLLAFPAGCGKEDSLCGPKAVWEESVQDNYIFENLDPLTGNRILIYEDLNTPENICTDEHVTARFSVFIRDEFGGLPAGFNITGKAYWGFFEREVQLVWDEAIEYYYGTITDIGLKQAFGTDPGWIGLQLRFTFPTMGTLALDTTGIRNLILNMDIKFDYFEDLATIGE